MPTLKVYDEIVNFIAAGPSSQGVSAFQPSEDARARVAELVSRAKTGALRTNEASELEHYLHLEHLMRLAKARAKQRLPYRKHA